MTREKLTNSITDKCDVLVIGAGPNGIKLANKLKEFAHTILIDKSGICGNLMLLPPEFPFASETQENLGVDISKPENHKVCVSELVNYFQRYCQLVVQESTAITLRGKDGDYLVETSNGIISTKKVVLSTGIMGKPKKFFQNNANIERFPSTKPFKGKDLLIVGGGDNAALAVLKYYKDNNIHWVYRSTTDTMIRKLFRLWKDQIPPLLNFNKINTYPENSIEELSEKSCLLSDKTSINFQHCLALIGYEYDQPFLSNFGIKLENCQPLLNFNTGETNKPGIYLCGIAMGKAMVSGTIKIPFLKDSDIVTSNIARHIEQALKSTS